MKAFVGITDFDWFNLLRKHDELEEINFWQPGGSRQFRTLSGGDLFLFKLHSPRNYIVGGGLFTYASLLPISLAWKAFGIGNGVESLDEMRGRTLRYRKSIADRSDFTVGCILLTQPFYLPEELWIPVPSDWSPNIVQGKTYDLTSEPGSSMFRQLQQAFEHLSVREPDAPRYGAGVFVKPRLGQGGFRVLVTDAYDRRCAISDERVLPVLEAAHVRPYSNGGEHSLTNGLLLRSDLHILFDQGYITVTRDKRLEVSSRIRDEFSNGHEYYALHGKALRAPRNPAKSVSDDNISWHNERIYLG